MVQALQDKLGPKHMTGEAVAAWQRVYGLIVTVIGDQMKQQAQAQAQS